MDGANVVFKGGVSREVTLAEDALEGLEAHVDALRVIFQM